MSSPIGTRQPRSAPQPVRQSRTGTSLPAPLRRDLEPAFRHDFARVRVHTDAQAAREARRLGASAFTVGHDISFAPGAYAPATSEGRRLLTHELTHVVQQAGSTPRDAHHLGASDGPAEHEAAVVAERVAAHRSAGTITSYAPLVQRQTDAGAPEPADLPVPLQAGWSPSTPGIFSILVESSKAAPPDTYGEASSRGLVPFSAQGRVEHFCSTPADYPLRIRFYLDAMAMPRPQPFRPPALAVTADFTPTGGSPRRIANAADSAPRYVGAGWPLAPAFGELFAASSSQGGLLSVRATMNDPDTATVITYRDTVGCELVPCA